MKKGIEGINELIYITAAVLCWGAGLQALFAKDYLHSIALSCLAISPTIISCCLMIEKRINNIRSIDNE